MSNDSHLLDFFYRIFCGFLTMGSAAIVMYPHKLTLLKCKRFESSTNQGQCQLISQGVFGSDIRTIPIQSLQGARIQIQKPTYDGMSGVTTAYRVVLLTAAGSVPFTNIYRWSRPRQQEKVQQICDFVEDQTQVKLDLKQDDRWTGYLIGVFFGGIGGLLVFSSILGIIRLAVS